MAETVKGVAVDDDARRPNDPVTVVTWPSRNGEKPIDQDADTWTDAYNYIAAGAQFKDGYPREPELKLNPHANPAPGNEPPEQSRPAPAAAPRPAPPATPAPSA